MKIRDLFRPGRPLLSLEIFPPVRDTDIATVYGTAQELAVLAPDFISVTYGAGGRGDHNTAVTAATIKEAYGIETLAHLTCIGSSRETVAANLELLQAKGLENVLALRGDPPKAGSGEELPYQHALDLIAEIKERNYFCIGAAAHPEGHVDSADPLRDLEHLKRKVAAGAAFLITQIFFDNSLFYRFRQRAAARGIRCPILAGIMPVLNKKQVNRLIYMCGASLPAPVIRLLVKYSHDPAALRQAGIEFAAAQIADLLAQGVDGVHIYTMNQAEIAQGIIRLLPDFQQFSKKGSFSNGL